MTFTNDTIWIIGASSGIGRELARRLAQQGATLILSARREDELNALRDELGKKHLVQPLDISSKEDVQKAVNHITKHVTSLDRVISLPALYKPAPIKEMDVDFMSKMVDVNIKGALFLTTALLPLFEKQQSGQIALCGSVAGYVGLPNGQPYSATKAAIVNFTESLRAESPTYLDIKLISPGFVETPMTDMNDFNMPMIITPRQAASYIAKGLVKKRFEIHFPKRFTLIVKLLSLLPYWLKMPLLKKIEMK